jgi:hypothetical protein
MRVQANVIDLEERRSREVFDAHWRRVRQLRREAIFTDEMPPQLVAVFTVYDGQPLFIVDAKLSDDELSVVTDLCENRFDRTAEWWFSLKSFDEVMGYWRSGSGRNLPWLRECTAS